jgi:predicted DCC family thiol-disulfide oxidoreductase YuxK
MVINKEAKKQLTVYYDGLCHLCGREITHYKRQVGAEQIEFVDICAPDFEAAKEGLDPFRVHKFMHARKSDGSVITGVDAFICIWQLLPRYKKYAKLAQWPVVRPFLNLGYIIFAQGIRPYLPKRNNAADCNDSPYCEIHKKEHRN